MGINLSVCLFSQTFDEVDQGHVHRLNPFHILLIFSKSNATSNPTMAHTFMVMGPPLNTHPKPIAS